MKRNKALFLPYKISNGKLRYFVCKKVGRREDLIPTGTCKKGEDQGQCAWRELKEELGIKHFRNFFCIGSSQKFTIDRNKYFEKAFAFEIDGPIKLQQSELSSYRFLSKREAIKLLSFKFHQDAINRCDDIIKNKKYQRIFVVVGPGGSGKDTIIHEVAKADKRIKKIKTYMTRHYKTRNDSKLRIYINEKNLRTLERAGDIIEKNKMVGYWYASSYLQIIKTLGSGYDGIVNVDINGSQFYQKNFSNVVSIFISAKTQDLTRRLVARHRDSSSYIKARMAVTKEEVAKSHCCDYTIVNRQNKLDQSVAQLSRIIEENRK